MELHEFRSASAAEVAFSKREITVVAVPYNEDALVEYRGSVVRERFMPGSFDGIETRSKHVPVNLEHSRRDAIGLVRDYDTKDPRGLVATMKISDIPDGDRALKLAADGVLKASVSFSVRSSDQEVKGGYRSVYRAFLHHIALTSEPAYAGADVIDVRTGEPMEDTPTPNLDLAASILREITGR